MSDLVHLIYTSVITPAFTEAELPDILARSRKNNERWNVTGILLFSGDSFFQVIEGSPEDVEHMFAKMSRDPRHTRLTLIIREAIPRRYFGDTTMSLSQLSTDELEEIISSNDGVRREELLACIDEGRAKKLLRAFTEGRWKSRLSPTMGTVNA